MLAKLQARHGRRDGLKLPANLDRGSGFMSHMSRWLAAVSKKSESRHPARARCQRRNSHPLGAQYFGRHKPRLANRAGLQQLAAGGEIRACIYGEPPFLHPRVLRASGPLGAGQLGARGCASSPKTDSATRSSRFGRKSSVNVSGRYQAMCSPPLALARIACPASPRGTAHQRPQILLSRPKREADRQHQERHENRNAVRRIIRSSTGRRSATGRAN